MKNSFLRELLFVICFTLAVDQVLTQEDVDREIEKTINFYENKQKSESVYEVIARRNLERKVLAEQEQEKRFYESGGLKYAYGGSVLGGLAGYCFAVKKWKNCGRENNFKHIAQKAVYRGLPFLTGVYFGTVVGACIGHINANFYKGNE